MGGSSRFGQLSQERRPWPPERLYRAASGAALEWLDLRRRAGCMGLVRRVEGDADRQFRLFLRSVHNDVDRSAIVAPGAGEAAEAHQLDTAVGLIDGLAGGLWLCELLHGFPLVMLLLSCDYKIITTWLGVKRKALRMPSSDDKIIPMITSAQCRAARAMLKWTSRALADKSGVSLPTITRFENDQKKTNPHMLKAIREALEAAGVRFIGETGVDVRGALREP